MNIEQLKTHAISITEGTEFHNPTPPTRTIALSPTAFSGAYRKRYNIENGIVSFVDETVSWFVIPAFKGTVQLLKNLGYVQAGIFVPCADGSYPVKDKEKWEKLLKQRSEGF